MYVLSKPQQSALLRKHLGGDVGKHNWQTIRRLIEIGMLREEGKRLIVTDTGREYCDLHHLEMSL